MIVVATELVVAADDRTGALEAAGAIADAGGGLVPVVCGLDPPVTERGARCIVIDLHSRHLPCETAAVRAAGVDQSRSSPEVARQAHKIDSTLRGNWASELVARQRASGRSVLVVPALPALGRSCVDGIVLDGGHPVHDGPAGGDARAPVRSSRPADHLRAAGAPAVIELRNGAGEALEAWLGAPDPPFAVCDAASDADVVAIGRAWCGASDVWLAGTSAAIGAAAAAILKGGASAPAPPAVVEPVLLVCGSRHPSARRQIDALACAGVPVVELGQPLDPLFDRTAAPRLGALVSPGPFTSRKSTVDRRDPRHERDAVTIASALAGATRSVLARVEVGTLVLIGGDTAAAVLGEEPMLVGGTVAPGMPWSRRLDGSGPLVLSRAGGFGGANDLVDLLIGKPAR